MHHILALTGDLQEITHCISLTGYNTMLLSCLFFCLFPSSIIFHDNCMDFLINNWDNYWTVHNRFSYLSCIKTLFNCIKTIDLVTYTMTFKLKIESSVSQIHLFWPIFYINLFSKYSWDSLCYFQDVKPVVKRLLFSWLVCQNWDCIALWIVYIKYMFCGLFI